MMTTPVNPDRPPRSAAEAYPVVVMAPVSAVFGAPGSWALIGWGVTWLVIAGTRLAGSGPSRAVPAPDSSITPTS